MNPILNHYREEYRKLERASFINNHSMLAQQRQAAMDSLLEKGFPSQKNESWRYIAKSPLLQQPFTMKASCIDAFEGALPISIQEAAQPTIRWVFINGYFSPHLSTASHDIPKGLKIESLANAILNHPEEAIAPWQGLSLELENSFAALNIALSQDGFIMSLEENCVIEPLVELYFLHDASLIKEVSPTLIPTRNRLKIGANSQIQLIEHHYIVQKGEVTALPSIFTNTLTELLIEQSAKVNWAQTIMSGETDCHIGHLSVTQHKNSYFNGASCVLGGGLVRHTLVSRLAGEGAQCTAKGLSFTKHRHQVDHQINIEHEASHTYSEVHYRGIADEQSRIAFGGEVHVLPGVAKIQAHQNSHNLLLSDQAEIDTKPRLTLFADDIKCTHGATVGELDEMALFYLQARGIPTGKARTMLIHAFGEAILQQMPLIARDATFKQKIASFIE